MKNSAGCIWIGIIIFASIGSYRMIRLFGVVNGLLLEAALIVLIGIVLFGYDRYNRWRSNRLGQSIHPGETLVASGLVSENISDETPAIVVRGIGKLYRVHIADSRGSQTVLSVSSELTRHANVNDMKGYIEMYTDQGVVHFAPRKGFIVAGQSDYAQEVILEMLSGGVPQKVNPKASNPSSS